MQSIKRLCLVLILLIFTLFATGTMIAGQVLAADWYDPDWEYRKMITIDSTKVPNTDRSYFPVLINTTDVDWRDTVNGGQVAQSNGGDILFTDSDGTTKLDHEIEKYDPSTGELIAWVKIPTVSASSDTDIYIYYGNATGGLAEWNITGTWNNNYVGVWHLSEDPSGAAPQMKDSTSNNNHGTSNGGMTTGDQVAGQIDGGLDFDGFNDYVNAGNDASLQIFDFTVTGWIYLDTLGMTDAIISKMAVGSYIGWSIWGRSTQYRFVFTARDPNYSEVAVNWFLSTGAWIHFAVVKSGLNVKLYKNGVLRKNSNLANDIGDVTFQDLVMGRFYYNYNNFYFDGIMDEVRISNTARSADWIKTSYNNQGSPSTFYTVGSEEALPDLIVSYLSIPKVRKNRRGHIARVFVDYRVVNQGDGDAVASELDFYLSRDTVLDGSDTYVGTVNIPSLASGEETHRLLNAKRFKLSRPVFSSGTWYLLGEADAGDDNVESDETNNVTSMLAAGSGR